MDRVLWSGDDWRPLWYAALAVTMLVLLVTVNVPASPPSEGPIVDAVPVIEMPYRRDGDR